MELDGEEAYVEKKDGYNERKALAITNLSVV
jgi:hypothetical protein